jgi:hypothetical protein
MDKWKHNQKQNSGHNSGVYDLKLFNSWIKIKFHMIQLL